MAKIGINDIISTSDKACAKFAKAVTASEHHMFDEVVTLIKELETTPQGNIRTSVANLKRVQQIRTKLYKLSNNKEYRKAVSELIKSFDTLYQQQLSFYATKNKTSVAQQKHNLVKTIARENTIAALTGDGLAANVTKQLDQMLLRAVTSGEKFADLQKEFQQYLISDKGGSGALSKYANTYAVTALSQYAGQNNKLFTEDLDAEWFEYVGSEIETTRPFCEACLKKRYIHRSEFHDVLKGHIHIIGGKDIDVPIYDKTGLPHGMIEGTNEDNFQVNVGGWNCRHQLIPVAKEAVPKNIRAKFESHTSEEMAHQKEEEEKKQKIAELKAQLAQYEQWKDADTSGIASAFASGDIDALTQNIGNMQAIEQQLSKLDLLINPKQAMQDFSIAELQAVQDAVAAKLAQFDAKGFIGQKLVEKLQFEADWVQQNKKYPTWQVAEQAYNKKLAEVQHDIALQELKADMLTVMGFKTKSLQYKAMLAELTQAYSDGDIPKAKQLIADMQAKAALMQKRQQQYAAKHLSTYFDDDAYSAERKNGALWEKGKDAQAKTDAKLRDKCGETWQAASEDERDAAYGYTSGSCYLNEPLRGISYCGGKGGRQKFQKHANALTALIGRNKYAIDRWVQRGGSQYEINARFGINLDSYRPKDANGLYVNGIVDSLVGKTGIEHGFLSTGSCKGNGFSGDVIMNIYCPRGTQGIYAEPFSAYGYGGGRNWDGISAQTSFGHEFETILQRGTEFRITKAEFKNGKWYIDMDVISQRPPALTEEQLTHA